MFCESNIFLRLLIYSPFDPVFRSNISIKYLANETVSVNIVLAKETVSVYKDFVNIFNLFYVWGISVYFLQ